MALSPGVIQLRGDYGTPSGSGLAKVVLHDIVATDAATAKTKLATFGNALRTNDFTDCNIGDVSITDKNLNFPTKPAADVNVDSKVEVSWRTKLDDSVRSLTISGISSTSANLEPADDGKRLTDAAKTTLGGLLSTLYDLEDPDGAIVLYGKYIVTR